MQNACPFALPRRISRRRLLHGLAGAGAVAGLLGAGRTGAAGEQHTRRKKPGPAVKKGRINQSVCVWCFDPMPLEELARNCVALGIKSIELVPVEQWGVLKKYGLVCAIANSHGFVKGFKAVDACAEAGFPNVITFSGFRNGIPDDVGLENSVLGLKKVIGYAEKKKVTLCLEVLNSRVDVEMKGHPGYMGDSVEWCVEVCKRIGSDRMKILFDIYHVQIMQGDLITRIRQYKDYIGHYHTAGVPGRNELDDNQEINYPAVMRAIVETGYKGFVAQEFIPTRDPVQSLREAVELCDV